ncbi:MAG TPA: hypothetical protein VFQ71_09685 [Gaiellales bacterium]|jgi:hypothetical protein|nr:hypothetical protein [Gaiellales bacterium]
MTSIRHLTRPVIVALLGLAVAVPAAQAMPAPRSQSDAASQPVRPAYPYAGQEFRQSVAPSLSAPLVRYRALLAGSPQSAAVPTPAAASAPSSGDNGFDWTDAAIGALFGAGILALAGLAGNRVRARGFAH